jgi:hypothetical protein
LLKTFPVLLLQALFGLLRKSVGKILESLFGWAVFALFGELRSDEKAFLSATVAAAACWPLLLAGIAFPKTAALVLGLLPIPKWVSSRSIRIAWIVLAAAVPLFVGFALGRRSGVAQWKKKPFWQKVLMGFPVTAGIASAFLVAFIAAPVRKAAAAIRGDSEEHVTLIVPTRIYHDVAAQLRDALIAGGIPVEEATPPWSSRVFARLLRALGGSILSSKIPKRLEHLRGPSLAASIYPNGATLTGKTIVTSRAHALIAERAIRTGAFQTTDAKAQAVESRIRALGVALESDKPPAAHHRTELTGILQELSELEVDYAEWETVYRETLQVALAIQGGANLLERAIASDAFVRSLAKAGHGKSSRFPRKARALARNRPLKSTTKGVLSVVERLANRFLAAFRR